MSETSEIYCTNVMCLILFMSETSEIHCTNVMCLILFMSEMSEIHCMNVMHLILFMLETSELLYYSCKEADSESESIELHALKLPLELLFMILWIT